MKSNTFLAAVFAVGLAGSGSAFAELLIECSAAADEKVKAEAEQMVGDDVYEVSLKCVDGWSGEVYFTETTELNDARFQLLGTKTTEDVVSDACSIDLVMTNSADVPAASKSEAKCSASKGNGKPGNTDKLEVEIKKVEP